jgi:ketosteroid isomerase-like protein
MNTSSHYDTFGDPNQHKGCGIDRSQVSGTAPSTTVLGRLASRQDGIPMTAEEARESGDTTPKVITFYHAGADVEHKTALFRMRGSLAHAGRVSATAVFLFLFMLTDRETVLNSFIALDRGGTPCARDRECDLLEDEYWIHSTNPEDGKDILYNFPIFPHMSTWQVPRALPRQWSHAGPERVEKTRSWSPDTD